MLGLETADTTASLVETKDLAVAESSKGATVVGADPAHVVTTGNIAETDVGCRLAAEKCMGALVSVNRG